MGSQESTHEVIRHSKCSLPVIHTYPRSTTHTLPFEFVLDASAPPTLRVPRCSVEYTVSARLVSAGMLHRMYLFGLRRYRASQTLILHSYPSTRNLYDLDMRMRSEIRQGVLGAEISHFNPVPFFAVLDRGIAHVGGKVAIHIVIDPPDHDNSSDVSSMSSIVSENSFQSGSSVGILGPEPRNRRSRYLLRKPITGTARPQCLLSTNTVTSAHPPVLKYRVRVTLEQLVRYTTQATSFDNAYSFDITKNVSASTQTTTADLACIDSGSHLTMELSIPSTLQCSIDTCNASVRYEARVVFCPVMFTGMLPIRLAKRTMSWIANKRTEIVFPVCVAPAPLNMLMGCPPPYSQ
ncbi:hypothetical protein IW139_001338 [Coemansia sp. RSA 353]|nr:hypothetical protein IW139_001338 [Coemansia sp. RSA 353]KAJ2434441.1 hypothetical protein IWW41_001470 [Coemansia sp. RSA 2522]